MKQINLRGITEFLSEREMKLVKGGDPLDFQIPPTDGNEAVDNTCSRTCKDGSHTITCYGTCEASENETNCYENGKWKGVIRCIN